MKTEMVNVVGIDLGTTNSAFACVDDTGMPRAMKNDEGELTTPSVVCVLDNGEVIVGREAKHAAAAYPEQTMREVKRQMGVMGKDGKPVACHVDGNGKVWVAEEISALIIKKLTNDALAVLKGPIGQLVVTVPAYFQGVERQATVNAAKIAGFDNVRVFDEPTSAALYYAITHAKKGLVRYLIYDLGGGTFDVAVIECEDGNTRVVATDGERRLGGTDFDMWIIGQFKEAAAQKGINLAEMDDPALLHELKDRAERTKFSLSARSEATLAMHVQGQQVSRAFTRSEFESGIRPLIEKTGEKIKSVLAAATLSPAQIDVTVLVGGSTRIPCVRTFIPTIMGKEPLMDADPDLVVAMGAVLAAVKYAQNSGDDVQSIGKKKVPRLIGEFVNATAHALGCAAIEPGSNKRIFVPIIPKNTPLPAECCQRFALVRAGQTGADVEIYQAADDNMSIDKCVAIDKVRLTGLPPTHPDDNRIEVKYSYDASAMIRVTVTDQVSGKIEKADVAHKHGLTESEVDEARRNLGGGQ